MEDINSTYNSKKVKQLLLKRDPRTKSSLHSLPTYVHSVNCTRAPFLKILPRRTHVMFARRHFFSAHAREHSYVRSDPDLFFSY